jgi:RHS repeat-associated protein
MRTAHEAIAEKRGANRYVYGVDPLGSVVHLLDSSLNRAATYVYWPYGEVQSHTGLDTPLQYVGGWGYYTSPVNRVYVRARDYRPDLGRWVTEDPIGFEGGDWNLYGYVQGGPSWVADSSGSGPILLQPPIRSITMPLCGCLECALGIVLAWYRSWQHACNHGYTHCMACCTLSRAVSPQCARDAQELQNRVPRFRGTPSTGNDGGATAPPAFG